jgi:hypothetical protein
MIKPLGRLHTHGHFAALPPLFHKHLTPDPMQSLSTNQTLLTTSPNSRSRPWFFGTPIPTRPIYTPIPVTWGATRFLYPFARDPSAYLPIVNRCVEPVTYSKTTDMSCAIHVAGGFGMQDTQAGGYVGGRELGEDGALCLSCCGG